MRCFTRFVLFYEEGIIMKRAIIPLLGIMLFFAANKVLAHPGSGIVVDRQGNVYFVDTGSGVYKIDRNGKLTRLSGPAYHWMAIDIDGRLTNVTLPYFPSGDATVTRVGADPTLLLSSDFPVAVGSDGSLCYPWLTADKQLQIFRLTPAGTTTVLMTLPATAESGPLRWLNGMAFGPDGSLYYTENKAIRRITPKGELVTFIENVTLSGCDSVPEVEENQGPYFRGLDVDAKGTVFVAATGCRAVLKITSDKKVTTVLRTSSPWSPTGVAVSGNDLYVLEYLHTPGDNRREWLPRIRKVASDGSVVTVASIDRR
jgi:sugar lactone lactonase YvrE